MICRTDQMGHSIFRFSIHKGCTKAFTARTLDRKKEKKNPIVVITRRQFSRGIPYSVVRLCLRSTQFYSIYGKQNAEWSSFAQRKTRKKKNPEIVLETQLQPHSMLLHAFQRMDGSMLCCCLFEFFIIIFFFTSYKSK